jgi:RimJ/RimL family protein N-acetyltransferase
MVVSPKEVRVVLRDGTRALLRPIRPEDRERLARGLAEVSPETRYLRFHAPVRRLTDQQLDYFTNVDQRDHLAWVALDLDDLDAAGMGVARCVRIADEPDVAEAAITVHDRYQGRGLGTVLLGVLARAARDQGIRVFRNYVLAENEPMLKLLDDLGATRSLEDSGAFRVDVPIGDPDDLPETPAARALRAAASGNLRLLLSAVAPIRVRDTVVEE